MTREKCSRDRESGIGVALVATCRIGVANRYRGKLADYMPGPYPNEEAARAGNGGYVDFTSRYGIILISQWSSP